MGGFRKASAQVLIAGMIRFGGGVGSLGTVMVKERCLAVMGPCSALALARPARLVETAPPCGSVSTR